MTRRLTIIGVAPALLVVGCGGEEAVQLTDEERAWCHVEDPGMYARDGNFNAVLLAAQRLGLDTESMEQSWRAALGYDEADPDPRLFLQSEAIARASTLVFAEDQDWMKACREAYRSR